MPTELNIHDEKFKKSVLNITSKRGHTQFDTAYNTCRTTGEVQVLLDNLEAIGRKLINTHDAITRLSKPQKDLQEKCVQIEGLKKWIADKERMQQRRLGPSGGEQEMNALPFSDGDDEQVNFECLQAQLTTAEGEISHLENAATEANLEISDVRGEQVKLESELETTKTQIGICAFYLIKVKSAFTDRQSAEHRQLDEYTRNIDAFLNDEDFHRYEQQQALLLDAQRTDKSSQQHASEAKLVLSSTEGGKPHLHQVELANQYGQMMGGEGNKVEGARCQYAQSLYDDATHETDDLQQGVNNFLDSQDQVLKSTEATQKLAEKARKKRFEEIMEAVNVDGMKNEADLIKRAMKPWVSYFARSDQLLAKAQKTLTPSRQHVSVDLQSAMSDALMRLILLLFLLLFTGLKKGFEKLGLEDRLTKAKDLALERLVLYRLKMNDGKLDLKAVVDDLKDIAKKDELFMNAAGKSGVDIESQSDEIMLKAAKIAYMIGVPLENIIGVGVGDPKKSPVHLSTASLAKLRTFVDDPQQQRDFGKRPVSYYDSSYQSKGQSWYEKMQNTWDDTIQFFQGGSDKIAPQNRSVTGAPDSLHTGGRPKSMTPAGGGSQTANPLQSLMGH